jgi:hypothetical protein
MNDQLQSQPYDSLPIKQGLKPATALSYVVLIMMVAASLAGLLFPSTLYPTEELRQSYLANDLVNLLLGMPILLVSMWLAERGKLFGLLCWPGALLYTFYNSIAYLTGIPVNIITVVFAGQMILSGYLIFDLILGIDLHAVRTQLTGVVPEKLSGAILVLFGVAFFFLAMGVLTEAMNDGTALPMTEIGIAIADLILSTFLVAGGLLLFLRKSLGYASGLGLLFATCTLIFGAMLVLLFQPILTAVPLALEGVITLAGMALVCFIPTGLFMRGVLSRQKTH